MKIAKLQQDAIEAHEAEMVGYEVCFLRVLSSIDGTMSYWGAPLHSKLLPLSEIQLSPVAGGC